MLIGLLFDYIDGRLVVWLFCFLVVGNFTGKLIGHLVIYLVCWLVYYFISLVGWLFR